MACAQEIASGASFFSTRRCGVARAGGQFYQEWISHPHSTFRGRFLLRLGGVVVVLELPGGSERPVKNEHCVDRPFPRSCPIPGCYINLGQFPAPPPPWPLPSALRFFGALRVLLISLLCCRPIFLPHLNLSEGFFLSQKRKRLIVTVGKTIRSTVQEMAGSLISTRGPNGPSYIVLEIAYRSAGNRHRQLRLLGLDVIRKLPG